MGYGYSLSCLVQSLLKKESVNGHNIPPMWTHWIHKELLGARLFKIAGPIEAKKHLLLADTPPGNGCSFHSDSMVGPFCHIHAQTHWLGPFVLSVCSLFPCAVEIIFHVPGVKPTHQQLPWIWMKILNNEKKKYRNSFPKNTKLFFI